LTEAVQALVSNGVTYGYGRVSVSVRPQAEGTVVVVEDDGPGIPAGLRDDVFEPFWRGGDVLTRSARGTGIGLALANQIAILHSGRLWISDSALGGAAVHMLIPAEGAEGVGLG
jgi:signal transduction histidine kinase